MGTDGNSPQPIELDKDEAVTVLEITAVEEEPAFNKFNLKEFTDLDIDVTLHGDLWFYQVWVKNPNFRDDSASFLETIARVGIDLEYGESFEAQFRVVGTDVHNRPENWTAPRRTDWSMRADLANVSLTGNLGGVISTLTVGIQELSYGDGLLIYDGYTEERAFWSTPIRSFPALKWSSRLSEVSTLDIFTAIVHDDYLTHEAFLGSRVLIEGGGQVTGANFNVLSRNLGEIDVGLFYKDDDTEKEDNAGLETSSNTWALSLRDSIRLRGFESMPEFIQRITLTGEIVKQWGRTKVVENTITNDRKDRNAWGGQVSIKYDFTDKDDSPYLMGRYAHFQGDSRSTSTVEAFDPFFSGYGDWGLWRIGDISGLFYPNSNKRAITLEFGMVPLERTKLRVLLHDISFDTEMQFSGSPQWSNEINVVFDYYPANPGFLNALGYQGECFLGAMVAAAAPGSAAEDFYGDDRTQTEVAVWAGLTF